MRNGVSERETKQAKRCELTLVLKLQSLSLAKNDIELITEYDEVNPSEVEAKEWSGFGQDLVGLW